MDNNTIHIGLSAGLKTCGIAFINQCCLHTLRMPFSFNKPGYSSVDFAFDNLKGLIEMNKSKEVKAFYEVYVPHLDKRFFRKNKKLVSDKSNLRNQLQSKLEGCTGVDKTEWRRYISQNRIKTSDLNKRLKELFNTQIRAKKLSACEMQAVGILCYGKYSEDK